MSAISPSVGTIEHVGDGPSAAVTSLGVVGYLNTVPLIAGVDRLAIFQMRCDVPAAQVGMLESGAVDLALCSVIDLVRSTVPLQVVPVGMLGCAGQTMTVRLFSRVPIEKITRIHCDTDSHTSIALLQVILQDRGCSQVELVPFDPSVELTADTQESIKDHEALLLIGDKVVTSGMTESSLTYQLDLGEAWFEMTGLPFVFATWLCPIEMSTEQQARVCSAARILDRMRRRNKLRLPQLATRYAAQYGWPENEAQRYLVDLLRYELNEEALKGMRRFLELAGESTSSVRLLDWA